MNISREDLETPRLQIIRKFDVAPEVVFDAFTKPKAIRVWWAADTTFDIDLKVGGRWAIIRREAYPQPVNIWK